MFDTERETPKYERSRFIEYVDIMLQPELIELLGETPRILAEKIPVLEYKETKWVAFQQKENGREIASSPFTFRPERIRVATEDEYFEVGCC